MEQPPLQPPPPPSGYTPHNSVGPTSTPPAANNKIAAGLCGIFLGAFGVHKFILGYNTEGIIMLIASVTCVGYPIMHIIGFIEGIIYLTQTDEAFVNNYVTNKKGWF